MGAPVLGLTVGPILFNWSSRAFADFYARLADEAPVDRVVIGELVCSKRLPFYEDEIPTAIERLQRAGKTVLLTSLALPTLPRERAAARELMHSGLEVEINDLSLMNAVDGAAFSIGPLVSVYNDATLAFLAVRGARRVSLPPEAPFASARDLAREGAALGVGVEVWAYGRAPLAISARCYHARVHSLSKDSCRFVCERDPDGLAVRTLDGRDFLAVNGVQTLSHATVNLVGDVAKLAEAGVTGLRLSPHSGDFVAVAKTFHDAIDGALAPEEALARTRALAPEATFTHGFLMGAYGAEPLAAG